MNKVNKLEEFFVVNKVNKLEEFFVVDKVNKLKEFSEFTEVMILSELNNIAEQKIIAAKFGRYFSHHRLNDKRSISRNVASLNRLVRDVINLFYYEH